MLPSPPPPPLPQLSQTQSVAILDWWRSCIRDLNARVSTYILLGHSTLFFCLPPPSPPPPSHRRTNKCCHVWLMGAVFKIMYAWDAYLFSRNILCFYVLVFCVWLFGDAYSLYNMYDKQCDWLVTPIHCITCMITSVTGWWRLFAV